LSRGKIGRIAVTNLETTFPTWAEQFRDVIDRLESHEAQVLLDVVHSSWLEGAEPTPGELEVLARQVRGEVAAEEALDLLLSQRRELPDGKA
jgi:hypothetical protein